jgi:hypothetical protein
VSSFSPLTVTDIRPSGEISMRAIAAPLARTPLMARLISASVNLVFDIATALFMGFPHVQSKPRKLNR